MSDDGPPPPQATNPLGSPGSPGFPGSPGSPGGMHAPLSAAHCLGMVREQLDHLERLVGPEARVVRAVQQDLKPAWQRVTEGENRLPVAAVIAVAVALQFALPSHLNLRPTWLVPGLEIALSIGLIVANPRRINRSSRALRATSLMLIALTSFANAWSAAQLVIGLINGTEGDAAGPLLANGGSIYLTNVIVFGLWYWEFDRGGPVERALAPRPYPDFLFPQMATPHVASPDWTPNFVDYLYVSFTNATAFSPTDTMPLSRWAKVLMSLQSAVALLTVVLVVSRAVNILK